MIEIGEPEEGYPQDPYRKKQEPTPESILEFQTQVINPAWDRFIELQRDLVLGNLTQREIELVHMYIKLIRLLFILDKQYSEIVEEDHPYQEAIDYYLGQFAGIVETSRARGGFTARNLQTKRFEERSEEVSRQKTGWLDRILRR